MDRTVETIFADWRAAMDRREGVTLDLDLEARIEVLRIEHAAAVDVRRCESRRLGPGDSRVN